MEDFTKDCASWTKGNVALLKYHKEEWCKVSHDERYLFEMLCLEGASVGLSWWLIMQKRSEYKRAFFNFDVSKCAQLTDKELDDILTKYDIVKNKSKVYSVRSNALAYINIQKEFGSFDKYIWSFTNGRSIVNHPKTVSEVQTQSKLSSVISQELKKRKMKYVGSIITYSYLQAIGIINDHLDNCKYKYKN